MQDIYVHNYIKYNNNYCCCRVFVTFILPLCIEYYYKCKDIHLVIIIYNVLIDALMDIKVYFIILQSIADSQTYHHYIASL